MNCIYTFLGRKMANSDVVHVVKCILKIKNQICEAMWKPNIILQAIPVQCAANILEYGILLGGTVDSSAAVCYKNR